MFTDITNLKRKGYKWDYPSEPKDLKKIKRLYKERFGERLTGFYKNPNVEVWVVQLDVKFNGNYPISINILTKKVKRLYPLISFVIINKEGLKVRPEKPLTKLEQLELDFKRVESRLLEAKRMYYKKHTSIMSDYEFDTLEKYSFKLAKQLGFRADKYKGPKKNEEKHVHWMIGYKGGV